MKKHFENLTCERCMGQCCRYVAVEIDKPKNKRDYDQIRWYLRHQDVHVFIDHDKDWCIEFKAKCAELGHDHRCLKYATRPNVCREHGVNKDCEYYKSQGDPYIICFDTAEQFEKYLDKRGIDWRWKSLKRNQ